MRVKCRAQEHNTMSLVRAQTWTACSGVGHVNHEAAEPLTSVYRVGSKKNEFKIIIIYASLMAYVFFL